MLVLDASIALSWCFEDEATAQTDQLLDQIRNTGATVPWLWHLEVGNILVKAQNRHRLTDAQVQDFLALIADLNLTTAEQSPHQIHTNVLQLAQRHHLTTYDACYLELAARLNLPLATHDEALRNSAGQLGVQTLPP